jgi:transposase
MRKVILKSMEENKYQIIKKLGETQGNKKTAAVKLSVSLRTINRLINNYRNRGKLGLVHVIVKEHHLPLIL